jgi:cold shock protein
MNGSVIWFKQTYGFIKSDTTGDDFFVHESAIDMEGFRTLKSDDRVTFDVELGPKGRPQAVNVQRVT